MAARHEREGLGGRPEARDRRPGGEHDDAPVEKFSDLDPPAGVGAPARAAGDGEQAWPQLHRIVAGHDALIATAERELEIAGRRAPDRLHGGRRPREAAIEIGEA